MKGILCVAAVLLGTIPLVSQAGPEDTLSFDVASIKPSAPDDRSERFITMQGAHQFVARNHTLKTLLMAAYNVPAPGVVGEPAWLDVDRYDIAAATPGENRPTLDVQMAMLRTLLGDRFQLAFHRDSPKPDFFAAMQQHSGLRLQASREPVDVIVIDRAERP
jgi:uncharacterized protein DUF3738